MDKDKLSQIKKGIEVEMEHTDDPKIALKIAMDHIKEDPKYYDKLTKAGLEELKRLQKLSGINEESDNAVDTIPEIQRYLKDLALRIPKVKGIDSKEVINLVAFIDLLVNKLGSGSIAPAIKAATDILNKRTQNLK